MMLRAGARRTAEAMADELIHRTSAVPSMTEPPPPEQWPVMLGVGGGDTAVLLSEACDTEAQAVRCAQQARTALANYLTPHLATLFRLGMQHAATVASEHCGDRRPSAETGAMEPCGACEWCMVASVVHAEAQRAE